MTTQQRLMPRRALLSLSDKTGVGELGTGLRALGIEIVSTGSTAAVLRDAGLEVTDVSSVTGFAEALDGRVKTLHPHIHGGILADLSKAEHVETLDSWDVEPIGLVVVNLYPFASTVASGAGEADVIENIDIGGPAMVRAAAKNHAHVAIVVDPARYPELLVELEAGGTTHAMRRELATEALAHTASYDLGISQWLSGGTLVSYRASLAGELRYGENSHQSAAVYEGLPATAGLAQAKVIQGKAMSYNNYLDAEAALRAAYDHEGAAVAIIKHQNPCGVAVHETLAHAHRLAFACDPLSAFGGVIAANREIDADTARSIVEAFTEVVVAPSFSPEALEVFAAKENLRIVVLPEGFTPPASEWRHISGGVLIQDTDQHFAPASQWTLVAGTQPSPEVMASLEFAWRAVRSVKSNAIVLAQGQATVGIGMGQVNRVDSCRLALERAGDRAPGSVAASDAFFPFADGLEILLAGGVSAVVQPGGSVRDAEVIAAAKAAGVALFTTGERHFFH